MDIKEFINLCAGKWFSQRTSYQLASRQVENHKSEITIDLLGPDHPEVVALCKQTHLQTDSCLGGLKASWDNSVDWGKPKQTGSSLLVFRPDAEDLATGQIARAGSSPIGHYRLRDDEALTLTVKENGRTYEERIWFPSQNFRLRTTIIQNPDQTRQTVFYSEIRRVVAPES
jgi:phycoerythrin-associated linker protein